MNVPNYEAIFDSYKKFCTLTKTKKIDLSAEIFFTPTTLLPLAVYINKHKKKITPPTNSNVKNYLELITGQRPPGILYKQTYSPLVKLPAKPQEFNSIYSTILKICKQGEKLGGPNTFQYLLDELTTNIYEHSGFNYSYVMLQRYPKGKFVEIVFVDDGKTIPGSYESAGVNCDEDYEYLKKALLGESTKKEKNRGFGLGTSVKLVCEQILGQIFLISRNGAFLAEKNNKKFFKVPNEYSYSGTLITIRIPYPAKNVPNGEFYETVKS